MTDVSMQAPKEGIRYVLYNGLITGPMEVDAKGRFSASIPGSWKARKYWNSDGSLVRSSPFPDCLLLQEYNPADFPTTLMEGARYFYVGGGVTEAPITRLRESSETFCLFDVGYQWDKFGKNLDYLDGPCPNHDLVVQLPLQLRVNLSSLRQSL